MEALKQVSVFQRAARVLEYSLMSKGRSDFSSIALILLTQVPCPGMLPLEETSQA